MTRFALIARPGREFGRGHSDYFAGAAVEIYRYRSVSRRGFRVFLQVEDHHFLCEVA